MRSYLAGVAILFFVALSLATDDKKCRALALRGGGTRGSYEIGVLNAFIDNLPAEELEYDVIVGGSIGSLNAVFLSLYSPQELKQGVKDLEHFYMTMIGKDTWDYWERGYVFAGIWESSFVNAQKVINLINNILDGKPFKRKVGWSSIDLNSGKVVLFDETIPDEYRAQAVYAGIAYPGFFQSVKIKDMNLVDGGTFDCLNLFLAINKCKELGFTEDQIIIDSIMPLYDPPFVKTWSFTESIHKNAWQYKKRGKEIHDLYYWIEPYTRVAKGFPDVNFRYLVFPSTDLPSKFIAIDNTKEDVIFTINQGYVDAENVIFNKTEPLRPFA